jgi:drug/metabolite transporter (DMT)-like permease
MEREGTGGALVRIDAETVGMLLGVIGVAVFSATLPATIVALDSFSPWFIALGRAALAGLAALPLLLATRAPRPTRAQLLGLIGAALGVVFGFPLLTSWAMQYVPAAHGGVVLGILPLATAVAGAVVAGDRPSLGFWLTGIAGSVIVVVYSLLDGGGNLHPADLALLAAIVLTAFGYAIGGRLSRDLGGWQTICWVLVISLPVTLPLALWQGTKIAAPPTTPALLAFIYVALASQFLGFFAWYRGLALGGVARVSQTQLLQPFLTLGLAVLLLGETITARTLIFAVLVIAVVAVGRRMPVRRIS